MSRVTTHSSLGLFDLTGRTALVTGSSRGIGKVLAFGLANAGAHVVLHGRDKTALATARAELEAAGASEVRTVAFEVTDPVAVRSAVTKLEWDTGGIDILVNNAGIQRRAAFTDFSVSDWDDLVATNLTSAFLVGQQVARAMITRRHGKIINIGSVQSQLGRPGIAPYAATKGGIVMLTKGMCADLAPYGICVNALAPGYFATELTSALVADQEFSAWVRTRTPAGRWGQVEDLIGTAVYLASAASDFVNGQVIYVDGGMTSVV
jgi:gluconate 5-dehydrogenase